MSINYDTSLDEDQIDRLDEELRELTGIDTDHLEMIGSQEDLPVGFEAGTEA